MAGNGALSVFAPRKNARFRGAKGDHNRQVLNFTHFAPTRQNAAFRRGLNLSQANIKQQRELPRRAAGLVPEQTIRYFVRLNSPETRRPIRRPLSAARPLSSVGRAGDS